jgi:hypothetical protein
MEKITASLRVTSCVVKPFAYGKDQANIGEAVEIKATGTWDSDSQAPNQASDNNAHFPMSLHMTVYPGCGVIPVIGDHVIVTVERPAPTFSFSGDSHSTKFENVTIER